MLLFISSSIGLSSCQQASDAAAVDCNTYPLSPAIEQTVRLFVESDSLPNEDKIYVALIRSDSVIGKTELHLIETPMVADIKNYLPLLVWK